MPDDGQLFSRSRTTDDWTDLGNGYDLVECVTVDGNRSVWLFSHDADDSNAGPTPAHERLGKLSPGAQAAVDAAFASVAQHSEDGRCEATSVTTGCRCRNMVKHGSRYCGRHAKRLGAIR